MFMAVHTEEPFCVCVQGALHPIIPGSSLLKKLTEQCVPCTHTGFTAAPLVYIKEEP